MLMLWHDLLEWDAHLIDDAVGDLRRAHKKAEESVDKLQRAFNHLVSQGRSIDQMRASLIENIHSAQRFAELLSDLTKATAQAAAGVDMVQTRVRYVQALAIENGVIIEADGSVNAPPATMERADTSSVDDTIQAVSTAVKSVMAAAEDIDLTYAKSLRNTLVELIAGAGPHFDSGSVLGPVAAAALMGGLFSFGGNHRPRRVPPSDRPPLDDILKEYQVSSDELVEWPGFPRNLFVEPRRMTKGETELLDKLWPWQQKAFVDVHDEAFARADKIFPPPTVGGKPDRNNNHNDAFRHAYWSARLAQEYGPEWADAYTVAHERLPGNEPSRETMDLYNNELGIRIARENPNASSDELAQLIKEAVDGGDAIVLDRNGDIAWSDQVGIHDTGDPDPNTPELPGKDPQGPPKDHRDS